MASPITQRPPSTAHPAAVTAPSAAPTAAGAIGEVLRAHGRDLLRFARALGAPGDVAEDLAQEAFVAAWRRGKLGIDAPALATFLRRAARNAWLDRHRGDRRRRAREAAVSAETERLWVAESGDERDARIAATRDCVAQLRGRAAEAVRLAYRDGASRERIAEALGMAPNGVRTLLARTRRWLETCILRRLT